ncbi:MAG: recombinase family protein [Mizugakiibacter sp.]|uniref:recombinase family protein n=1 Tax=Mizugakiibacter sp. TaxID=1972610 RepID=UPI00320FCE3A
MRLLAYVRVSTEEQAREGHSLGLQPRRCADYCALHGHVLVGTVADEGVSASTPLGRRKGGAELLRRLRAGDADGVVVVALDRLFRDVLDGVQMFREFEDRELAVHSIRELLDTRTPAGRLQLHIQLATAQYERELTAQRCREVSAGLREQGRVFGTVPYGCVEQGGRLFRDPATWPTRQLIVNWRRHGAAVHGSTGDHAPEMRPVSYRAIRDWLHADRVPAPAGGRWWSTSTLRSLCESHDALVHLPMTSDVTAAACAAPESGVSAHV